MIKFNCIKCYDTGSIYGPFDQDVVADGLVITGMQCSCACDERGHLELVHRIEKDKVLKSVRARADRAVDAAFERRDQ